MSDDLMRVGKEIIIFGEFDAFDIAEILEGYRVDGVKSDGNKCALANYLKRETGIEDITVGFKYSRVGNRLIHNPPSVQSFLFLYDQGRFPVLETATSRAQAPLISVTKQMRKYLEPWLAGEAPRTTEQDDRARCEPVSSRVAV